MLNSVAIAFVFQLDSMLYGSILSGAERKRFQAAVTKSPRPLAAHRTPKSLNIATLYGWVIYFVDFGIAFYAYLYYVSRWLGRDFNCVINGEFNTTYRSVVRWHIMIRGVIATVAHGHLAVVQRRSSSQPVFRSREATARLVLGGALSIGVVAFIYTVVMYGLLQTLFFIDQFLEISPMFSACAMTPGESEFEARCVAFHTSHRDVVTIEMAIEALELGANAMGGIEQMLYSAWYDEAPKCTLMRFGFRPSGAILGPALLHPNAVAFITAKYGNFSLFEAAVDARVAATRPGDTCDTRPARQACNHLFA